MDALTAPRAFKKSESMSQNKMRGLGIEESDSKNNMDNKNNVLSHHQEAAKPRGKLQTGISYKRQKLSIVNKESTYFTSTEEMKFDPITLETLRQEKGYQKVLRKQQKELESLKKRHHKEKVSVQKQHCVAIEKIFKGKKLVIFIQF